MLVTHRYLGVTKGDYRCLFFLVIEDYIEEQLAFSREFDLHLERFARNLGDAAVLVRPFKGDIEQAHADVLGKPWTKPENNRIARTPGLLMINVGFDEFDPQEHSWLHISFGNQRDAIGHPAEAAAVLKQLATVVTKNNVDLFDRAQAVVKKHELRKLGDLFEAKPGAFGFSVDLKKAPAAVKGLFQR